MQGACGPAVIRLACGADDRDRRCAEIAALVDALGGRATPPSAIAMQITVPAAHAARFVAGLVLAGATIADPPPDIAASDFLILLVPETLA
ncbi:MAG: hypothetical protein NW203_05535 [Hyphomonadaceae bacterium]|nr:hypothetical protein [Hyphomonadaceae bacterium]